MAGYKGNDDYVEVAPRIAEWYSRHPEGRIETELLEFPEHRVVMKARVYRDQDSQWPSGVGHSYLYVPGSTPFTKGSELENAETSAVGRALVMAGIPSKAVASTTETKAKKGNAPQQDWGAQVSVGSGEGSTGKRAEPSGGMTTAPPATAGTGSPAVVCPDCGEPGRTTARLTKGQQQEGFVRCANRTCERVYKPGALHVV